MVQYIFVTGGVVSSLGKGISAASIACLLEGIGKRVTLIKLDPYINIDPGTMSPFQHGEVYVTEDGAETDLDLGHYERFSSVTMTRLNNTTTGQIYNAVIEKERNGTYLGKTIQVVPHIIDEIKERIVNLATGDVEIIISEIGGTVGDIESLPFLEAIRQLRQEVGPGNAINIHLTLVPYINAAKELKTKPTQHSVQKLREIGIQPDILLCRTDRVLPEEIKSKIAFFCNLSKNGVISAKDVESIYDLPLFFKSEGLLRKICDLLDITIENEDGIREWEEIARKIRYPKYSATIGVVGKYVDLQDAYKSLNEALVHGGLANETDVNVRWIEASSIDLKCPEETLKGLHAILVPGGFGERGIEGKIAAIKYARETNTPFFGICLGLQCAVIELARNVLGLEGANSTEFDKAAQHPVINLMEEQKKVKQKGGTMRKGNFLCKLAPGSLAARIYNAEETSERHRHRFEFNGEYRSDFEKAGLTFSGWNPEYGLAEIVELSEHAWFLACQFHPEYASRPRAPHPLFAAFVASALKNAGNSKRNC